MAFVTYSQPLVRDVKHLIGPFSPMRPDLGIAMDYAAASVMAT